MGRHGDSVRLLLSFFCLFSVFLSFLQVFEATCSVSILGADSVHCFLLIVSFIFNQAPDSLQVDKLSLHFQSSSGFVYR